MLRIISLAEKLGPFVGTTWTRFVLCLVKAGASRALSETYTTWSRAQMSEDDVSGRGLMHDVNKHH